MSPAVLGERLAEVRAARGVTATGYYPNDVEDSPGVVCSDTINPRSFGAWQKSADQAERQYSYFGEPLGDLEPHCRRPIRGFPSGVIRLPRPYG